MNIVLLQPADWQTADQVRLNDRRAVHLCQVLNVQPGDEIRVGMVNGNAGTGKVLAREGTSVLLDVSLSRAPGPRHPFELVVALPRPKMLRRVLRTAAEFGVQKLHLLNSYRVEKSYWQSPLLTQEKLEDAFLAGMERAGDTQMPLIELHPRYRPFVEDVLPELCMQRRCLIAHPGDYPSLGDATDPAVVMIGPEGGFIPFEIDLAASNGAEPVSIGSRTLSVDTAVTASLAIAAT